MYLLDKGMSNPEFCMLLRNELRKQFDFQLRFMENAPKNNNGTIDWSQLNPSQIAEYDDCVAACNKWIAILHAFERKQEYLDKEVCRREQRAIQG